jgi:hypothetical protein
MRDMKLLSILVNVNYLSWNQIHLLMIFNQMKLLQNILSDQ